MGKYLGLVSYGGPQAKATTTHPADHQAHLAKVAESVGGKVVASYWMLGAYDLVVVLDCPDSASAKAIHLAVVAGGAASRAEVYPILDGEDAQTLMSRTEDAIAAHGSSGK